jgi:PAS domain-containing protein
MLDMRTLILSYAITNILVTLFIASLWYPNRARYAGLGFWLVGFVLQVVGFLFLLLRDVAPDFVSIVLASVLTQVGRLCLYVGLERFVGKPSSQIHNYILIGGFAGLTTHFTFAQPNLDIRMILLSSVTMLLTLQSGWLMLRRVEPSLRSITREVGIVFLSVACMAFARIVELYARPVPITGGPFEMPPIQVVFMLIDQMLTIALTFTLILMVTRRLESDVRSEDAQRQRAQQEIERLASFPRLAPYPVLEVDATGRITFQNDAATVLLERVKPAGRVLLPPDLPKIWQSFARQEQRTVYREVEIDGMILGESINYVPQFDVARIYTIDITERKRVEEFLQVQVRLLEFAATHSLDELLRATLDEVGAMTDSPIGFYHFVEPDQETLTLQAWSTRTVKEFCTARGKGLHYGID